jgi:hypothetical protein
MYHLSEAYLMAAYISLLAAYLGALIFGTGAVAPLAVRLLPEDAAALLLRAYWPRFHKFAVIAGLGFTLVAAAGAGFSALPVAYVSLLVALAGLMTLSFYTGLRLIPAVNNARDAGNEKRFNRLHRLDVVLVSTGMLTGLLLLIALVYVLPGQFTFWPAAGL